MSIQMLRTNDLMKILNVSRTTLWRIMGKDPSFPEAICLGAGIKVWYSKDISEWLESKRKRAPS